MWIAGKVLHKTRSTAEEAAVYAYDKVIGDESWQSDPHYGQYRGGD